MTANRTFIVDWVLFLRAASPRSMESLVRRFARAIGRPVTAVQGGQYWKMPALYRVDAFTHLDTPDVRTAVFDALRMGECVGGGVAH